MELDLWPSLLELTTLWPDTSLYVTLFATEMASGLQSEQFSYFKGNSTNATPPGCEGNNFRSDT